MKVLDLKFKILDKSPGNVYLWVPESVSYFVRVVFLDSDETKKKHGQFINIMTQVNNQNRKEESRLNVIYNSA